MKKINVAIDGPAAGGKTTVARLLAAKLGLIYVDTGMMYRAVSWQALQSGCNLDDVEALGEVARNLALCLKADPGSGCKVYVADRDLTELLHEPEINAVVSKVAAVSLVRKDMVRRQRELAEEGGIVMAGRDICTVVLPDARLKYYLDASLEERARRRVKDLESSGHKVSFEEVKEQLAKRDYEDSHRADSPLVRVPEAKYIDSDNYSAQEIVDIMAQDYQLALSED